jgi:hypothetical protein
MGSTDNPSDLTPVLTVVDAEGNVVATTDDPFDYPLYSSVLPDNGISLLVVDASEAGDYYLEVSDKNGMGGPSYWYDLLGDVSYDSTAFTPPMALHPDYYTAVEDASTPTSSSVAITMASSTTTTTTDFGEFGGRFDTDDTFDTFRIDTAPNGFSGGRYLNISSSTTTVGSIATIEIDVFDATGAMLTSATGDNIPTGDYLYAKFPNDPSVVDFQLPDKTTGPLYIEIKNTNASDGVGAFYYGDVDITTDPVY